MESLHGPLNPSLYEDGYFNGDSLEQESNNTLGYCTTSYKLFGNSTYSFNFEDQETEEDLKIPSLDDNRMSFLQMLQSVDNKRPNFLLPPQTGTNMNPIWQLEPESCLTREGPDTHSPVRSETQEGQGRNPHWVSGVSSGCYQEQTNSPEKSTSPVENESPVAADNGRKRRKRNRSRVVKEKEDVENQRMTHIAVERNRRRQMNEHLSALRSLMPPSYIQRGDQASIVGGAINLVKELEQLLESLQDRKRMRKLAEEEEEEEEGGGDTSTTTTVAPPQHGDFTEENKCKKELRSEMGKVQVTVIQNHVNLKISNCERRRPGQLVKAIVGLEQLRFTVLHLNITSFQTSSVHYSFSLKMEDDCKLESAEEIAGAVHQIFSFINGTCDDIIEERAQKYCSSSIDQGLGKEKNVIKLNPSYHT